MRLYASSAEADPRSLRPGEDLVLRLEIPHGTSLAEGVFVEDYLASAERPRIDDAALAAMRQWRDTFEESLTVDGMPLPWVWELELFASVFYPIVKDAIALRCALERLRPGRIELIATSASMERTIRAVTGSLGIEVTRRPWSGSRSSRAQTSSAPLGNRVRQGSVDAIATLGVPSRLRQDAALLIGYWSLMPTLDRMLETRGCRPAVHLEMRPVGPMRSFRCAISGGWIGIPSKRAIRREDRRLRRMLDAIANPEPLETAGIELGEAIHRDALDFARRGGRDIARAKVLMRAFARRRPHVVVLPYDATPEARCLVFAARQSGVRTLVVAHGGYSWEAPVREYETSDEVAVWSSQGRVSLKNTDRPIYVVGYPGPPPATRSLSKRSTARVRPRIAVLEELHASHSALLGPRVTARHYTAALQAVRASSSSAQVILRPNPGSDGRTAEASARAFPDLDVEIDRSSEITELLASVDVCVGALSTATLQAALVNTPIVMLNVTGRDWPWPLGGDTPVPVAGSEEALIGWLGRALTERSLPGREALLEALGAGDADDSRDRLLEIIRSPGRSDAG